jgi:hypothetical protein
MGVRECIVWRVLDQEIDWFVLRAGQYERVSLDGVRLAHRGYRSYTPVEKATLPMPPATPGPPGGPRCQSPR